MQAVLRGVDRVDGSLATALSLSLTELHGELTSQVLYQ